MHEGDICNPSIGNEVIQFIFFLRAIIHIFIFKQVPKYLATRLYRPLGTYSPPAEASTQWLNVKFVL
jgi:hypothetical protein